MTQLDNPSHTDPARFGALAALVSGGVVWALVPWVFPILRNASRFGLAIAAGLCTGIALGRRLARKRKEAEVAAMQAHRAAHRMMYTDPQKEEE